MYVVVIGLIAGTGCALPPLIKPVITWKKRIFYGQADCKGWPPPPPLRSGVLWFFLRGTFDFGLWLCIKHKLKLILTKKDFWPSVWPFGWVKTSIASSNKRGNGAKKAMTRSASNMHFFFFFWTRTRPVYWIIWGYTPQKRRMCLVTRGSWGQNQEYTLSGLRHLLPQTV